MNEENLAGKKYIKAAHIYKKHMIKHACTYIYICIDIDICIYVQT